jgi:hypothetical protein
MTEYNMVPWPDARSKPTYRPANTVRAWAPLLNGYAISDSASPTKLAGDSPEAKIPFVAGSANGHETLLGSLAELSVPSFHHDLDLPLRRSGCVGVEETGKGNHQAKPFP